MNFRSFFESNAYSPEAIDLAKKIISNQVKLSDGCIDEPTVMYDAIWHQLPGMPYFINIHVNIPGKGLGWIAFLDFISKVGQNEQFISTDVTGDGRRLFQKAVSQHRMLLLAIIQCGLLLGMLICF